MSAPRAAYLERAGEALERIRAQNRYRTIREAEPTGCVDFASNDYLGLARDRRVREALGRCTRVGSGGARLLGGAHREHALLEGELAQWLGRERALLFSSGYHAALGAVTALAPLCAKVLSDARNHASLIDGIRLCRTPYEVLTHRALPASESADGGRLIVTESLFGMDGDAADLAAIVARLGAADVLLIDEAHALGIVGDRGTGLAARFDDPRIVVIGTLSKAFGTFGGFVAGPAVVIELMINTARTFIFDTALPPAIALAARIALHLVSGADERRARLHANVDRLRAGLQALGFATGAGAAPIVPLVLGDEAHALALAAGLARQHVYAPAIRPPTVPPDGARLRFSVRADHAVEEIDRAIEAVGRCTATS